MLPTTAASATPSPWTTTCTAVRADPVPGMAMQSSEGVDCHCDLAAAYREDEQRGDQDGVRTGRAQDERDDPRQSGSRHGEDEPHERQHAGQGRPRPPRPCGIRRPCPPYHGPPGQPASWPSAAASWMRTTSTRWPCCWTRTAERWRTSVPTATSQRLGGASDARYVVSVTPDGEYAVVVGYRGAPADSGDTATRLSLGSSSRAKHRGLRR